MNLLGISFHPDFRYYWRKSTQISGIALTKVATKWSQINYVDAAYEVKHRDVVYLFEGDFELMEIEIMSLLSKSVLLKMFFALYCVTQRYHDKHYFFHR